MAQSLNVIALISGGKDSLFSLLHCIQNGHRIVALANLYPPSSSSLSASGKDDGDEHVGEEEDLNSFMYQTVGHTLIPLYAEALQLPLYRREISGKAVDQARDYDYVLQSSRNHDGDGPGAQHEFDETEDLTRLLGQVKFHHPEANALSSGAILSTYQRTRVESVASRLGLASLSFLWQYPLLPPPPERPDSVTGLLDDMEAAGCDFRIIKIASAGIRESMLFRRVTDPQVREILVRGMGRFVDVEKGHKLELRGAVLGEGGEYETIAINGPPRLWKKRISVDERTNRMVREEGDVCRVVIGESRLVEQSGDESIEDKTKLVRTPGLFDDKFQQIKIDLSKEDSHLSNPKVSSQSILTWQLPQLSQNISESQSTVSFNNLTDPDASADIEKQVAAILCQLEGQLKSQNRRASKLNHVTFILIILRNMSDFAALNLAYSRYFDRVNPPARVTICCGEILPKSVLVSMSAFAVSKDLAQVNGLHVQSISYWAPANIGPYSQAISYPNLPSVGEAWKIVELAGQIPLVPSSMQLLESSFLDQAILSLQNLWRVGQCEGVDWWTHGIAYLSDGDSETIKDRVTVAREVWKAAHVRQMVETEIEGIRDEDEENESFDVWDLKNNHQVLRHATSQTHSPDRYLHTLPNHRVVEDNSSLPTGDDVNPPFTAAHIEALPRSAPIEWHSLGIAGLAKSVHCQGPLARFKETCEAFSLTCYGLRSAKASVAHSFLASESEGSASEQADLSSEFFVIQIFSRAGTSASAPVDDLSQSISGSLSTLQRLWPGRFSPSNPSSTNDINIKDCHLTAYLSTELAYDAIQTVGLLDNGNGKGSLIIPCHSLWGDHGKSLEMVLLGRHNSKAILAHNLM